MEEINKNLSNEENNKVPLLVKSINIIDKNIKEKPNSQTPHMKTPNLSLPKINITNTSIPTLNLKTPCVKSNSNIRQSSTSESNSRQNYFHNYLSRITSNYSPERYNNNSNFNYCATVEMNQKNKGMNNYNNINTKLNIIKDEKEKDKEKFEHNAHHRNLELIKKLVERRKKLMEEKIEMHKKNQKNSSERFDLFKKSLINNGIALIPHKKLEPININDPKNITDNTTYYYKIIHEGNNSEVIEECLKRRGNWKVFTGEENHLYYSNSNNSSLNNGSFIENNQNNTFPEVTYPNFLWSHCCSRINFEDYIRGKPGTIRRMTNHFEFQKEISNKLNLFMNMMIFCESNNLDIFSMLPMTLPMKYESELFLFNMSSFNDIFNNIEKYISDNHLEFKYRDLFQLDKKGKIGNKTFFHIPKTHYIGRNLWLVKAIDLNRGRCIKISDNIKEIKNIIKNFYIGVKKQFDKKGEYHNNDTIKENNKEDENNNNEKEENKNENNEISHNLIKRKLNLPELTKNADNVAKSQINTMSNNIKIISTKDLKNNLKTKKKIDIKKEHSKKKNFSQSPKNIRENIINTYKQFKLYSNNPKTYQNSSVILQKYIEKPLLYKGRKCDMRLWVMLTWDFNVYLFKEGHFKATSVPFDINSQNAFVHLTNYSVQKYNENFAKFETGNEISFTDFEISKNNIISVKNDLLPKIKEIIIYTMKCARHKINKFERKLCFEIFGYDFMFDEDYKPYLLEINTNPGLEISSPLIEMLIPRLIDDAFKITIDKVFLISQNNIEKMKNNPLKVGGYDDNENMWEFLGNV